MSNLKPIIVTLKEGRHKTQPWTFTIDRPGPQKGETKRERYVSMWSAKRGAARVIANGDKDVLDEVLWNGFISSMDKNNRLRFRDVKFIVQRLKRKP